jgi:hypothetical protein
MCAIAKDGYEAIHQVSIRATFRQSGRRRCVGLHHARAGASYFTLNEQFLLLGVSQKRVK